MSGRVDAARLAVRKVLRDARDKNKWRKIVKFRLWMPVALQILLVAGAALLHHLAVPGLRQRLQHRTDPHPGAPPDRGRDGPDPRAPGRVSRSVGRRHDRPRGGHRLVPDRRRGFPPPDPVRDRRHPGLRRRPRPRQRGPDPGTQDPLDHRHPGHAEHPGRDLTDDATDGAGRHRSRTDLRAHGEHRADPRGVHRHRRRGGSRRSLAPCFRIGSGAEGRGLRRSVGQTGRGQNQPAPGPGPHPVGRAGGRGRVLRHGPVPDRERDHRIHLRPEQHHRRRPGRRRPRRRPGHVPGEHGGGAPARAHHHRPTLPRSVTRRRAADHRRLGAVRDRPVPARRPEGARQEQLQACPAPGHEEPATQGRHAPGLLPERPRLPRGADGQDADPRRDGAQHGSRARGPPIGRRADRGGEDPRGRAGPVERRGRGDRRGGHDRHARLRRQPPAHLGGPAPQHRDRRPAGGQDELHLVRPAQAGAGVPARKTRTSATWSRRSERSTRGSPPCSTGPTSRTRPPTPTR